MGGDRRQLLLKLGVSLSVCVYVWRFVFVSSFVVHQFLGNKQLAQNVSPPQKNPTQNSNPLTSPRPPKNPIYIQDKLFLFFFIFVLLINTEEYVFSFVNHALSRKGRL